MLKAISFLAAAATLGSNLLAATPTPVAYVYVGTPAGVRLYDAAANGQLSLVAGSPFAVSGLAIGSNGKYFVSLGTNYVHNYALATNGAIKGQVSQINTALYASNQCGATHGAVLDHSGQYLYVELADAPDGAGGQICTSLQTYKLASTNGFG